MRLGRRLHLARMLVRRLAHVNDDVYVVGARIADVERRIEQLGTDLVAGQNALSDAQRELVERLGRQLLDDQRALLGAQPGRPVRDRQRPASWRLGALTEVQDSVHLVARRLPLPRRPARVLFLVHMIETWGALEPIVKAMQDASDFDPIVATIPHHFNGDSDQTGEEELSRRLAARAIPHLRLPSVEPDTLRLIKYLDPDLVFRQSQWDQDVPEPFAAHHLDFARLCLMPYEMMNIVENVPDGNGANTALDSDLHRAAWVVFCTNDLVRQAALDANARGGEQFAVVGHPKADELRGARPAWPVPAAAGAKRVVWSAHHTISTGWTDFGLFPEIAEDMLTWATESSEISFVFSPHPALIPFFDSPDCPYSRQQFDDWLDRWQRLANTAIVRDGDYMPLLAASDLLVTDGLSMLVEYLIMNRPLVFIERPGHRRFNAIGQLVVSGAHTVGSVKEAREAADLLLTDDDPLATRQRELVASLFGPADRPAASRVLDVLRERIEAERG